MIEKTYTHQSSVNKKYSAVSPLPVFDGVVITLSLDTVLSLSDDVVMCALGDRAFTHSSRTIKSLPESSRIIKSLPETNQQTKTFEVNNG